MVFGDRRGSWAASPEDAAAIVKRFAQAGGTSSTPPTTYTLSADPDDPNAGGSHRKSLRRAIDGSLQRLGTGYIDLYWPHIWDAFTPVEEVITALNAVAEARGASASQVAIAWGCVPSSDEP